MKSLTQTWLGSATKVKVDDENTTIIEGKGDSKLIKARKSLIESQIIAADAAFKKEDYRKRLAKLGGGVAVINVGAATETELKEVKMRIDDALNATKAAVEEGVVSGGGLTLFQATNVLDKLELKGDEKTGLKIVKRSLQEPIRQIAENTGVEGAEVIARLKTEADSGVGFNAKNSKFENLVKVGVIDPTKVIRSALQNAASISAMVLTTEALVTDFDSEKEEKQDTIII